jgi:DNA-binding response OmpR family regulator
MKVLVVDDNRALARSVQEILEDEGAEVMSAYITALHPYKSEKRRRT